MNLLQIHYFLTTVDCLSFTQAAETWLRTAERLERARAAQKGLSGRLNIGVLDGTQVDELLPPALEQFSRAYPYVEISLSYHSFNTLASMLYDGGLDLALTLYFDIQARENSASGCWRAAATISPCCAGTPWPSVNPSVWQS